jgi:leucyl-tRNA synthetase
MHSLLSKNMPAAKKQKKSKALSVKRIQNKLQRAPHVVKAEPAHGTYNFTAVEKKWQAEWEKKKVFVALPDKRTKFFFTTPYPYISGSLHLGHGRAAIESDLYCRFMRMAGFNVLYPMAFHITGTPVLGISAAIKNGNKDTINLYESYVAAYERNPQRVREIVASFVEPQAIVNFFIPKMEAEYRQLGLGVDWSKQFTSGDMEHQQLVTWQFEQYREKGYLTKGKYPVLYCPADQSAMGEDDIKDADCNPVEKQEFTLLKFAYGKKFLVAATLRPETVYGQTNLWVNPKVSYVEVVVGKETWIMSTEAAEKLRYQLPSVRVTGSVQQQLVGIRVRAPLIERDLLVLPSRFVDADIGTGIVTSVPSDAPYDYVALKELQENPAELQRHGINPDEVEDIEIIPIISTKKYGDKAGVQAVEQAGVALQDDPRLERLTQEVYKEGYHNGVLLPVCGPYAGLTVREAKKQMQQRLFSDGAAAAMWETTRKAVSRSGGKVIVAVLDNQWFIDFAAKGWKDVATECLQQTAIMPESFRSQFEDTFVWLDKRPCVRRRGLGTQFPFDSDWIIESLSDSTIYMVLYPIIDIIKKHRLSRKQLNRAFFDYVLLGRGSVANAEKQSGVKSAVLTEMRAAYLYWMPIDQRHTFVLHLPNHLSFMLFAFAGLLPPRDWPKKISFHGLIVSGGSKMSKSKGNVVTILRINEQYGADVFRFYLTSVTNLEGTFDWRESEARAAQATIQKLFSELSEAISKRAKGTVRPLYVSMFHSLLKRARAQIEAMKLREYNNTVVFDMLRFVKEAKHTLPDKELRALYDMIAGDWIKLIAPVCPHLAEELWHNLGNNGFVSIAPWPGHDEERINLELEAERQILEKTIDDIKNVLRLVQEKKGKKSENVYLYVLPSEKEKYDAASLSKRLGKAVTVFAVDNPEKHDPENKSAKAKPGKPGIYVA